MTTYRMGVDEGLLHVGAVGIRHLALVHAHVVEGQVVNEQVAVGQYLSQRHT